MEDDAASIVGTKIVVDYEGCTISHLTLVNPTILKKLVAVSQVCLSPISYNALGKVSPIVLVVVNLAALLSSEPK